MRFFFRLRPTSPKTFPAPTETLQEDLKSANQAGRNSRESTSLFSKSFFNKRESSFDASEYSDIRGNLEDCSGRLELSPPFYKKQGRHLQRPPAEAGEIEQSTELCQPLVAATLAQEAEETQVSFNMIKSILDQLKDTKDFRSVCMELWGKIQEQHPLLMQEFEEFRTYYAEQIEWMQKKSWKERAGKLNEDLLQARQDKNYEVMERAEIEIQNLELSRKKMLKDFYKLLNVVSSQMRIPRYAYKAFGRRGFQSDVDINICPLSKRKGGLDAIDHFDFSIMVYEKIIANSLFGFLTGSCSRISLNAEFYVEHVGSYFDLSKFPDQEGKKYYTQVLLLVHFLSLFELFKEQPDRYKRYVQNFKGHFFPRLKKSIKKEKFEKYLEIILGEVEEFHRQQAAIERQYAAISCPCNRENTFRASMMLHHIERFEEIGKKMQDKQHRIDVQSLRSQKMLVWSLLNLHVEDGYFLPGTFRVVCLLKGGQMGKEDDIKNQERFKKGLMVRKKVHKLAKAADLVESAIENGAHYLRKLCAAKDFSDFLQAAKYGQRFNEGAVRFYHQLSDKNLSLPKKNRSSNDLLLKSSSSSGQGMALLKARSTKDRLRALAKRLTFLSSARIFRSRSLHQRKRSLEDVSILDLARRKDFLSLEEAIILTKHYINDDQSNHTLILEALHSALEEKVAQLLIKFERQCNARFLRACVNFTEEKFLELILQTYPKLDESEQEDIEDFLKEEFAQLLKTLQEQQVYDKDRIIELIDAFGYRKLKGFSLWGVGEVQRFSILEDVVKRHYHAAIPGDLAFEPVADDENRRSYLSLHAHNLGFTGLFPFKNEVGEKYGFSSFHHKLQGVFDAISNVRTMRRAEILDSLELNSSDFCIDKQIEEAMNVVPELFADAFNFDILMIDYRYYQDLSPLYLLVKKRVGNSFHPRVNSTPVFSVRNEEVQNPQFVRSFTMGSLGGSLGGSFKTSLGRSFKRKPSSPLARTSTSPAAVLKTPFKLDTCGAACKADAVATPSKWRRVQKMMLAILRLTNLKPTREQRRLSQPPQDEDSSQVQECHEPPEKDLWKGLLATVKVSRVLIQKVRERRSSLRSSEEIQPVFE